jgi:hypothetical protein
MKVSIPLFLSLFLVPLALAQPFPVPASAERAVSTGELAGAAGDQTNPRIATNGSISLLAWDDTRENASNVVYGTRLDADGNALDPLGVRLGAGRLKGVLWNGDAFVVVIDTTLVLVTPDLAITNRQLTLPTGNWFYATAGSGASGRLLFLSGTGDIAIVDGRGNLIVTKKIENSFFGVTACATDDRFLILIGGRFADLLDRDGNLLFSRTTGLPIGGAIVQDDVIAGGNDGFLYVHHDSATGEVTGYRLNATPETIGQPIKIYTPATAERHLLYRASIVREGSRYLVVWQAVLDPQHSYESIAEIGADDSVSVRRIDDWNGQGVGIALASSGGRRVMATSMSRTDASSTGMDIVVRALSDPLQPSAAQLATSSTAEQRIVSLAPSAHGYAVTWTEGNLSGVTRAMLRRFSAAGVPLDDAPIEIVAATYNPLNGGPTASATVIANDDTYLVAWAQPLPQPPPSFGTFVRRLAADTGAWIDPQPIPVPFAGRLASNGADAVLVGSSSCGVFTQCIKARRLAMKGELQLSPEITVRTTPNGYEIDEVIVTSNGTDYLVAWSESLSCPGSPCGQPPQQVHAARLRADGTVIDAQPLLLDVTGRHAFGLTAAWSGGRYLVGWGDFEGVRGTRVTAEGAVLDRDGTGGAVLLFPTPQDAYPVLRDLSMTVVGGPKHFLLLLDHAADDFTTHVVTRFVDGLTLDPNQELTNLEALPRTTVFDVGDHVYSVLGAARGSTLGLAYTRSPQSASGVLRGFFRLYMEPIGRRRASTH